MLGIIFFAIGYPLETVQLHRDGNKKLLLNYWQGFHKGESIRHSQIRIEQFKTTFVSQSR